MSVKTYSGDGRVYYHHLGESTVDEYQRKLPESIANDITQQVHLMFCLKDISLTLSDMMDIVADHTLPFPTTLVNSSTKSTQPIYNPMDLSNIDTEVNTVNETIQYHHSGGIGHIAR